MKKLEKLTLKELGNSFETLNNEEANRMKGGGWQYFEGQWTYMLEEVTCVQFMYGSAQEAQQAAMSYSSATQNECSGFVLADGSAVLYISPNATHSGTDYPPGSVNYCIGGTDITTWNGVQVLSTFHTHFNSPLFSNYGTNPTGPNDQSAQSNYFPNSDLTILYCNNNYTYHFEYGIYIP